MKAIQYILIIVTLSSFFSCQKEDNEPQRTTHIVTLYNNTGITGCGAAGLTVTFNVYYRDVNLIVAVDADRSAIINVLVEDGETINVEVRKTSDQTLLANSSVSVRTDSRPDHLEDEFRFISYCLAFDLSFSNF